MDQCKITRTRHTFDRALRALPLTQHKRVWALYLKFARQYNLPETAIRVYRRYVKVCDIANSYWDAMKVVDVLRVCSCMSVVSPPVDKHSA